MGRGFIFVLWQIYGGGLYICLIVSNEHEFEVYNRGICVCGLFSTESGGYYLCMCMFLELLLL